MTAGIDEVDLEAIGSQPSIDKMLEIAYPRPGYVAPPFTGGGFVIRVNTFADYASAIRQKLQEIIPRPTPTSTSTPTATPSATATPEATPTPTATSTPTPGATPTTPTPTATPLAPQITHTLVWRSACSTCHAVGGGGVGAPGGTGLPAGHQGRADSTCTTCHQAAAAASPRNVLVSRSADHDVVEVDRSGNIVRRLTGLNLPTDARPLSYHRWLIADAGDNRVIEVEPDTGAIIWGVSGITSPASANLLPNGNILIVERSIPPRVLEVTRSRTVAWSYTLDFLCVGTSCSGYPQDAARRGNGNTVIAIASSAQGVIEVDPSGNVVWEYPGVIAYSVVPLVDGGILTMHSSVETGGGARGVNRNKEIFWEYTGLYLARDAQVMSNGNVLVADNSPTQNRVMEIDPNTNTVVWQWISAASGPSSAVEAIPVLANKVYLPLNIGGYVSGW